MNFSPSLLLNNFPLKFQTQWQAALRGQISQLLLKYFSSAACRSYFEQMVQARLLFPRIQPLNNVQVIAL
jgi:hypothetical protein